jgi:hypothetical protein
LRPREAYNTRSGGDWLGRQSMTELVGAIRNHTQTTSTTLFSLRQPFS